MCSSFSVRNRFAATFEWKKEEKGSLVFSLFFGKQLPIQEKKYEARDTQRCKKIFFVDSHSVPKNEGGGALNNFRGATHTHISLEQSDVWHLFSNSPLSPPLPPSNVTNGRRTVVVVVGMITLLPPPLFWKVWDDPNWRDSEKGKKGTSVMRLSRKKPSSFRVRGEETVDCISKVEIWRKCTKHSPRGAS